MGRWFTHFDRLVRVVGWLGACLLVPLVLTISFEVVMRYVFNHPTTWQLAVTEFGLLIMTFCGAALALQEGKHVTAGVIVDHLSPRSRRRVSIVTDCLTIVYAGIIVYVTLKLAIMSLVRHWIHLELAGMPLFPFYFVMPAGGLLLFGQAIVQLVKRASQRN